MNTKRSVLACLLTALSLALAAPAWAEEAAALQPVQSQPRPEGEPEQGGEQEALQRPWLGIIIQEVNENIANTLGLEDIKGVLVSDVSKGGPADEAGINTGDVILKLNGRDIEKADDFITGIQEAEAGSTVVLEVSREGATEEVDVTLGQRPENAVIQYGRPAPPPMAMGKDMAGCAGAMQGACPGRSGGYGMDCPMADGTGGGKYGKMYLMALDSLDLSAEQKKKTDAITSDYLKKSIRYGADIKIAEVELKDILASEPVSLEKARAKINEIGAKKSELKFFRVKSLEDIKKVLTAEQRGRLEEMFSGKGMFPAHRGIKKGCKGPNGHHQMMNGLESHWMMRP